jgi:hypothetical protein
MAALVKVVAAAALLVLACLPPAACGTCAVVFDFDGTIKRETGAWDHLRSPASLRPLSHRPSTRSTPARPHRAADGSAAAAIRGIVEDVQRNPSIKLGLASLSCTVSYIKRWVLTSFAAQRHGPFI